MDKGVAIFSVTPAGKAQKAGRLGFKLVRKSPVGKVIKFNKNVKNPVLPTEEKVGTFRELAKQGKAFDNITPHHMPSAAKMKQTDVKRRDGVSMNMEQPHPGVGGRHRGTYTYGLNGKNSKNTRA